MKKFLVALSSVFLFAGSLSAQITINKNNALPYGGSVFAKDEVRTITFDTVYSIFSRNFDSSTNLGFTSSNFNGYGGAFIWDSTLSVYNGNVYATPDSSGFMIMDSEGMNTTDTQRVYLTSTAISTQSVNGLKLVISHYYNYSLNDSIAAVMISKNGTDWALVRNYTTLAMDQGTPLAFVSDTITVPDSFLNQSNVMVRFVYATTDGGQWAIDKVTAWGNHFNPGYTFFKPGGATFKTWNLSNIQYDGGYKYHVRKAAPSPYRFIDSLYNEDLMALQHTTYGLNYFTIDGIIAHAHLTYGQEIHLNPVTGTDDTLVIPVQFHLPYVKTPIPYSAFHIKYAYPMSYNTRWNSDYAFTSRFDLVGESFVVSQYDTFRCSRFTHIVEKDTIVGFGQMTIKDINGGVNDSIPVLQLKTNITQIDSVWVDTFSFGTTPYRQSKAAQFQAFMNNKSGWNGDTKVWTYTKISYVRIGEILPLVTVFMQDTFVNRIEVHTNHPWVLGMEEVATADNGDGVTVYPNPVSGRMVNIDIPGAASAKWNCEVFNSVGQNVASKQLDLGANNHATLELPSVIAPGMYFLHITKDGKTYTMKPIQVQN